MIDISKPLTSRKVQSYYRSEYSSASNSYFSQGGALQGEWQGQLAGTSGLSGAVTPEAFDRLAEGKHPQTGEQLIQHRDTIKTQSGEELGHRAGWDLTFNAPKTVSLTALVGEDGRVRRAHQDAVRVALTETEKYVQARLGGNLPAENTSKWIAATFEHDTARPVNGYPAPHLHTHVVVFNLTEDAHGQARSLQPYELFKVQSMSTAVYQNALEHELRQLGYRIERGKNHAPEIRGYTREYLAAESLRAAEIERAMAERGLTGREAESIVKHQNRDEKLRLTSEELRALHQEKAVAFGNQPQTVVEEASHRKGWHPYVDQTLGKAAAAIAFARERLSERTAVFEHFEVIRDALRQVQGRVPLPPIQAELDRQLAVGQFVKVDHIRPSAPAARYSTPQLLEVERAAIGRMRAGLDQMPPIAFVRGAEMDRRFSHLNDDQRRLVGDALASRDQIFGIQGGAGTGKTTALTAIREIAEENGYRTLGLGPTSRAAKGLREARIDAETMQAFLLRERPAGDDPRDRLFFVDETSLASGRQLRDFLERLQPSDRVLLVGDTRQHQSVEAGRIFAELQEAGMRAATLSQIVRQKDEGLRQVVEAMASGHIGDGVDLLSQQNRVHGVPRREERFATIAQAFADAPRGTLVVSPDNESRRELNTAIREELKARGQIEPNSFDVPILINRQEITGEDRKQARSYRVGDTVRYLRGSDALNLEPKSYAVVLQSDPDSNQITVKTESGKVVTYDPARVKGVGIYETELRSFAVGDRVQFTSPWKEKAVSNRDIGTITRLDAAGNVTVSFDDSGRTVAWNLNDHKHIDHAYAMTSHSSQGATVDRVLIHIDTGDSRNRALINETLAYVATSRPRYDAQVFTDDPTQLVKALSRKEANATALSPDQIAAYAMSI